MNSDLMASSNRDAVLRRRKVGSVHMRLTPQSAGTGSEEQHFPGEALLLLGIIRYPFDRL